MIFTWHIQRLQQNSQMNLGSDDQQTQAQALLQQSNPQGQQPQIQQPQTQGQHQMQLGTQNQQSINPMATNMFQQRNFPMAQDTLTMNMQNFVQSHGASQQQQQQRAQQQTVQQQQVQQPQMQNQQQQQQKQQQAQSQ